MLAPDKKISSLTGELESPFQKEDLFLKETEAEWEAHLAALEEESPFRRIYRAGKRLLPLLHLRHTIRQVTEDERQKWRDKNGMLRYEGASEQFGHLIRYWLACEADIRPDTLQDIQENAAVITYHSSFFNRVNPPAGVITNTRQALLKNAKGQGATRNLNILVERALKRAHISHHDFILVGEKTKIHQAWSAAFVISCIRETAMKLKLEEMRGGRHEGKNILLLISKMGRHMDYVIEAYNRRERNTQGITYRAFKPRDRQVSIGDIIMLDGKCIEETCKRFTNKDVVSLEKKLPERHKTHGDIVVEVDLPGKYVVAVGGNISDPDDPDADPTRDSVRRRRFPLDDDGRLKVESNLLFEQEKNNGHLPGLSGPDNNLDSKVLHPRSTGRIFALLSLAYRANNQTGTVPEVQEGEVREGLVEKDTWDDTDEFTADEAETQAEEGLAELEEDVERHYDEDAPYTEEDEAVFHEDTSSLLNEKHFPDADMPYSEEEEVEAPYIEGEEEGTFLEEGDVEFFANENSYLEVEPLAGDVAWTEAEEQEHLEESVYTEELTDDDEYEFELEEQLPESEEEFDEEGELPTDPDRSSMLDYQKANRLNRVYGRRLGWQDRLRDINRILGLANDTPEERDFVDAVVKWQRARGLVADGILGPNTWRRMRPVLARVPTTSVPQPSSVASLRLRQRIAEIANKEWLTWGRGTRKETEPGMHGTLSKYWLTVRGKEKAENAIRTREAWSAAFVSWVMQESKIGNAFRKSPLHAAYVNAAKRAREIADTSKFWAYRINETKPEIGDVVVNDRCRRRGRGSCAVCYNTTYDNVGDRNKKGYLFRKSHGDIVAGIDVSRNRIKVIGGNVNNSVGHKWINLDPNGYLPAYTRGGCQYIAILKSPARDEPTFEAEKSTNKLCTVFIPRRLPVRFRRILPDFLDEVVRAVGRFTVFRSDAGRRARSLVAWQEIILEEMHRQMLRLGIPEGGHVEVPAIFTYQGQKAGMRCRPQRVTNVTLFNVLEDLSSGGSPI